MNLSMKQKLFIALYAVAIIPLITIIVNSYYFTSKGIKERELNKLTAIRDLKVSEINFWFDEVARDITLLSQNDEVIYHIQKNTSQKKWSKRTISQLNHFLSLRTEYLDIFIVNNQLNRVFFNTNQKISDYNYLFRFQKDSLHTEMVNFSHAFHHSFYNKIAISAIVPVFNNNDSIISYIGATINLSNSLFTILQNRIGVGNTGESFLINEEKLAISELKWANNAPLKLQINAEPAQRAIAGETGIVESEDYRGETVFAAYTYIHRMRWGFVAKQDKSELFAPVYKMLSRYIVILLITLLFVFFVVLLIIKKFYSPVYGLVNSAQQITKGNFNVKFSYIEDEKFNILVKALNQLLDNIIQKNEINKSISVLTERVIAADTNNAFRKTLLKTMLELTHSVMGAYFEYSKKQNRFLLKTSIGYTGNNKLHFDINMLEGEVGRVITFRDIIFTKIDEKNIFGQYKSAIGNLKTVEMVSIPIVNNNTVQAVLTLASLNYYTPTEKQIIIQSQLQMKTIYIKVITTLETRKLANKLNASNKLLVRQSEKLKQQTVELQEQASELQSQNVELDMQRSQIEETSKLKSEFLSNISHELRTPLNSVIALSKILIMQTETKLNSEELNYLNIIEKNGKNLLNLINDILDLSKIEAGKMGVENNEVVLENLFTSIYERLKPLADKKNIGFHLYKPEKLPIILSDHKKLIQVFQNISNNAIKFTNTGKVEIDVQIHNNLLVVKISDTGIGIPAGAIKYIFDEFRQVDGTPSKHFEGTGLGLSIAKENTELLGGEISVRSNENEGSVFSVTLPLTFVQKTSQDTKTKNKPQIIFVVDSDQQNTRMINEYLTEYGYEIIEFNSADNVVEYAIKHKPFAIILDLLMPETNGFEIIYKLQNKPQTQNIPIIVVSISKDKNKALSTGAKAFIQKPINKNDLLKSISSATNKPKQILVVDNNEIERRQIKRLLENSNFDVIEAKSSEECMQQIESSKPDLIVIDLLANDIDGFQILNTLKNNKNWQNIPVVISTHKELTENQKDELKGNVSKILNKSKTAPIDTLEEVKNILNNIQKKTQNNEQKKILVVEDNEAAIVQLKFILNQYDYLVEVANGGKAAIDFLSNNKTDGVILDLMMPEIDGKKVLDFIRKNERTKELPVLILTAKELSVKEKKELSDLNVEFLCVKGSVDKDELMADIEKLVNRDTTRKQPSESDNKVQHNKPERKKNNKIDNRLSNN